MSFRIRTLGFVGFVMLSLAQEVRNEAASGQETSLPAVVYRIQPGDVVDVRFFFNPELNEQNVRVRPDGRIALQLSGDVDLAGKTADEASRMIEDLFAKELKSPRVSIQIRQYESQKVFVSGEVPKPGMISLASHMTILAALSEAGGITITGNRKRVMLIRKGEDGKPEHRQVTLFAGGRATNQAMEHLRPFDVILVPESKIARVDRWVDQYLRKISPANLFVGFNYLWQRAPEAITF
jgi:polysaccharide export outer membrane protein